MPISEREAIHIERFAEYFIISLKYRQKVAFGDREYGNRRIQRNALAEV